MEDFIVINYVCPDKGKCDECIDCLHRMPHKLEISCGDPCEASFRRCAPIFAKIDSNMGRIL